MDSYHGRLRYFKIYDRDTCPDLNDTPPRCDYVQSQTVMIRIAVDTCCLNARKHHRILNKLDRLYADGKVELLVSRVNQRDVSAASATTRDMYLGRIKRLKFMYETAYWGMSVWGGSVVGNMRVHQSLIDIFTDGGQHKMNDFWDFWLLETAIANRCDYFLTLNKKHFIDGGRQERIEALGIKVREPDSQFLTEIVHVPTDK